MSASAWGVSTWDAFTWVFVIALALGVLLQWRLGNRHLRHIRAHRQAVPDEFREKIPLEAHQKAADYTCAKTRLQIVELLISSLLLLVWTLGGVLDSVDVAVRSWQLSPRWEGTVFILLMMALCFLLSLPLAAWRVFRLEQRFGFNKTTPRLFFLDLVKTVALGAALGTPLIILALWFMAAGGEWWWFYAWLTWLGFNLFMTWAYPAFIAPWFNRFSPLEDQELTGRVNDLLRRNGFASKGIFIMDGSTRSTHGNAYFSGLGANKRIVFFDTLMDELSHEEIEAVLAHELGHFKCAHVKQRITLMAVTFLLGCALLGALLNQPWFYAGLGMTHPSNHAALVLFVLAAPVFTVFLQPLFSFISRRHEFEADDFAASQVRADSLVSALVKLYRENANTLTPDPLYSAFHDSHPSAPVRIAHLTAAG